jgi:hypothetical protein
MQIHHWGLQSNVSLLAAILNARQLQKIGLRVSTAIEKLLTF